MRVLTALTACGLPTSSQAKTIHGLFNYMDSSGCQFLAHGVLEGKTQTWLEAMGSTATAIASLESQGFRCCAKPIPNPPGTPDQGCTTSYLSDSGITCVGRLESYPKPVAIVIPPNYKPEEHAELVTYLHGNNPSNLGISYFLEKYELAKSLATSKRNSILIFPSSASSGDSMTEDYDSFFGDSTKVDAFYAEAGKVLVKAKLAAKPTPKGIVLTAHSGGYRGMTKLLEGTSAASKKIDEAYCLDCMYWNHGAFVNFAKTPGKRLWAVTTPKGDTHRGASCVQKLLEEKSIHYFGCRTMADTCPAPGAINGPPGISNPDCGIEARRSSFNADDFGKNRIGFVHSEVDHEDVVTRYLPTLLGGGF